MRHIEQAAHAIHAVNVKVAISVPDTVFAEAESLAKEVNTSRNEIYSRALREFLGGHAPERVTERMNEVVARVRGEAAPFTKRAARRVLRRVEW